MLHSDDVELIDLELSLIHSTARALTTSSQTYVDRQAVLLRLRAYVAGFEVIGVGESAPLPGWSAEPISHVRRELQRVRDMILGGACSDPVAALQQLRAPTARFGFSTALLDAIGHGMQLPLRKLFNRDAPHSVHTNAMIGVLPIDAATDAAVAAWARGFRVVKLKVGDAEDVRRVAAVRDALPEATIRLDANGAWTLDEARSKLAAFAPLEIAYIEQPVATAHLADLRGGPIAIAADEGCLPITQVATLLERNAVDTLVLKPSLLGAWHEVIEVVEQAQRADVEVVFSSALDFAIAQTAIAQVAAALLPDTVCGLATGRHPVDVLSRESLVGDRFVLGSGNGLGIQAKFDCD